MPMSFRTWWQGHLTAARTLGVVVALGVSVIPDVDLALAGAFSAFVIAWIISMAATARVWSRLHPSLKLLQIGVSLSVLATLVRLGEALANNGVIKELGLADAIAGPGIIAIATGVWLAAKARAALARNSDILDAAAFAVIPVGVLAGVVAERLTDPAVPLTHSLAWVFFFTVDAYLMVMVVLMIFGPGVRNRAAVWIGLAGLSLLVFDLVNGAGSILEASWQDAPSRTLAFAITAYAIATTYHDYPDIASPGTREQRYRGAVYAVGSVGIMALCLAARNSELPVQIAVNVTTGTFMAIMAARIAHASLTANRLQHIGDVQAHLAEELPRCSAPAAVVDTATAACRNLAPGSDVEVTLSDATTGVVASSANVRIVAHGSVAPHLVVAYTQIAHVVEIALEALDARLRQAEEDQRRVAVEATTDPVTKWRTQSQLLSTELPRGDVLAIVSCPEIAALTRAEGKRAGDELARLIAKRIDRARPLRLPLIDRWRGEGASFILRLRGHVDLAAVDRLLTGDGYLVDGNVVAPLVAIGAFRIDEPMPAGDALLRARMAVDHIKAGKSAWWTPELKERADRRWAIATAFRRSLSNPSGSGFQVHYQGLVDATTTAPVALEALARWVHPKLGPITPGEFIPIAEAEGLVDALDRWVLDTALADLAHFREVVPTVKVHVNLSPIGDLSAKIDTLAHTIRLQHARRAGALVVELTETVVDQNDNERLQAAFARLRQTGAGLALDDFGTGQSNLARLARMPFTEVKLGDVFVTSDDSARLLGSIVPAIRDLGLPIVAENVETKEDLAAVRAAGVDWIQGWYFSRAQPLPEILNWLRRQVDAAGGGSSTIPDAAAGPDGLAEPDQPSKASRSQRTPKPKRVIRADDETTIDVM